MWGHRWGDTEYKKDGKWYWVEYEFTTTFIDRSFNHSFGMHEDGVEAIEDLHILVAYDEDDKDVTSEINNSEDIKKIIGIAQGDI